MIDQPQNVQNKGSPRSLNHQQLINFDNLMNNKQQLKMHHIEDALASVLDDMKQLDFSTSSPVQASGVSNTKSQQQQQGIKCNPIKVNTGVPSNNPTSATNKTISNIVSSLSSSQTPSSSSSSSTSSTSSNNGKRDNAGHQLTNNKINDLTDENLSNSSDEELNTKQGSRSLKTGGSDLQSGSNTNFNNKSEVSSSAVIIGKSLTVCI